MEVDGYDWIIAINTSPALICIVQTASIHNSAVFIRKVIITGWPVNAVNKNTNRIPNLHSHQ